MMQNLCVRAGFAVAAVAVGTANASIVNQYNQIVVGSLQTGQDTEGRAFVGGNLTGSAMQFGTHLLPDSSYLNVDVLQVGGNIGVNNLHMEAGNLRRSGSRSGTLDFNGGGQEFVDPAVASWVSAYSTELQAVSSHLAGLATNSTITGPTNQPAALKFFATPGVNGVAVFTISAADLSSNLVQQIELHGSASSYVINVTGTGMNFNAGNFVSSFQSQAVRATTIWNFVSAENITLDRNWNGAILAPFAHLTNTTAIDGSVFVESMTQNGEVHLPGYTGYIPTPGAVSLATLGLVTAARRRR
jgi:choice-of-anchor A domain-containing protein